MKDTRVVVVGAGISGLAAAHALLERGAKVEVVEAGPAAGGRIRTFMEDGYLVEGGPNAVMDRDPRIKRLISATSGPWDPAPAKAPRYIVHGGRPVAVPMHPIRFLTSPLMPMAARLRLLGEPFIRPAAQETEETVKQFVARRFGRGVLPLADAMVTGVHAGDPGRLSARKTLGPAVAWERQGGVLRNLRKAAPGRAALVAPRQGMQSWTEALARPMDVEYGQNVQKIETNRNSVTVQCRDQGIQADHVVLATDAGAAHRILAGRSPAPPVAPVAVVAFGLPREGLRINGYGVLIPELEKRFLLGATLESALFPDRAPSGRVLVRGFVGGRRHPERASLPEHVLLDRAWQDLVALGVTQGEPEYSRVFKTSGIPQLEVGHASWVSALHRHSRVHVLGMGHKDIGITALVRQAFDTAASVPSRL